MKYFQFYYACNFYFGFESDQHSVTIRIWVSFKNKVRAEVSASTLVSVSVKYELVQPSWWWNRDDTQSTHCLDEMAARISPDKKLPNDVGFGVYHRNEQNRTGTNATWIERNLSILKRDISDNLGFANISSQSDLLICIAQSCSMLRITGSAASISIVWKGLGPCIQSYFWYDWPNSKSQLNFTLTQIFILRSQCNHSFGGRVLSKTPKRSCGAFTTSSGT